MSWLKPAEHLFHTDPVVLLEKDGVDVIEDVVHQDEQAPGEVVVGQRFDGYHEQKNEAGEVKLFKHQGFPDIACQSLGIPPLSFFHRPLQA